jgi:hypothetical protein
MAETATQWYLRKGGVVSGPFNRSVIQKHLIVGRLALDDEASPDASQWKAISEHPELHASSDNEHARRHLDERTGLDRRKEQGNEIPPEGIIRRGERRNDEPDDEQSRRDFRRFVMRRYLTRSEDKWRPFTLLVIVFSVLLFIAFVFPTKIPMSTADCQSAPVPGVDWTNCLMSRVRLDQADLAEAKLRNVQMSDSSLINVNLTGADLAFSNLRHSKFSYSRFIGANLKGANLSESDLSHADLTDADLSYADLSNTLLHTANLSGSKLDRAIWINGEICAVGSVGQCLISPH